MSNLHRRGFLRGAAALAVAGFGTTISGGVAMAAPPEGRVPSILPPGNWTPDPNRSDEFDGTSWNPEKWATDHWTAGGGGIHFDPERVTVHGGKLHIEVRRPVGDLVADPWRAGLLHSTFTIGGDTYLEVRAKMIPFEARVNSAIWIQQQAEQNSDDNLNVEIDLQEYHLDNDQAGRQNIRSALHLWRFIEDGKNEDLLAGRPDIGQTYPAGVDLGAGFHMYGLARRNGEVNLYFDGEIYRRVHEDLDNQQHRELFATQERPLIMACNGLAPGVPAAEGDMEIDHVRVFTAA
jgi:Glycosyl hydrolases family 16